MKFYTADGARIDSYAQMLMALVQQAGSERKAAALFGLAQASFNAWCRGRAFPNDDQAATMGKLLNLDPAYVLAVIHLERAHNKESERAVIDAWKRVAEKFKDAAVVAAVAFGAASFGMPAPAEANFTLPRLSSGSGQNSAANASGIHIVQHTTQPKPPAS